MACAHHWMIDPPQGAISRGRCLFCRETREFWNVPKHYYPTKDYDSLALRQENLKALMAKEGASRWPTRNASL